jgi:cobalt-zinc-cadmium efflux system outer membrane protein
MRSWKFLTAGLRGLWVAALAGCATVDPRPDYERARDEIRSSTGEVDIFDPEGPALPAEEIQAMLSDGLGLEEATRLALLDNRRLQAGFMALGVARSEYVQAGLLKNPSLSLAFLFPDAGGRARWTADLAGSVSEIWEIPLRKDVAQARLDQRILELSRFAGELVAATKEAYFEGVAAREARSIARANADLARRSLAAVRRQVEEGTATKSDESLAESFASSAELSVHRAEREEISAKRRLAALLSFEEDLLDVALTDSLPGPSWPGLEREALVQRSVHARPDLRAAARAVAAAEEQVALERRRVVPGLAACLSAERPEGGSSADFLLGPGATVEIPLFDQNQAQLSRAEFRLAELTKEHAALMSEITQEMRAAADSASIAARAAAFAQEELIPQAERSAALAQRAYELGDTIVLSFLQSQRTLLEARRIGIDALLEAARANIALERAIGVPLAAARPTEARP